MVRINGPLVSPINRSRRSGPLKGGGRSVGFALRYLWILVEFDAGRLLCCYPCLDPSPDESRQGKQASPGGEIGRVADGALIDAARRLAPPPARGRPSPRRRLPQVGDRLLDLLFFSITTDKERGNLMRDSWWWRRSARHFGRAIVMPNLKPPITTTAAAVAYRQSILKALPPDSGFDPLMTLYLTDNTSPEEIKLASEFLFFFFFFWVLCQIVWFLSLNKPLRIE